MSGRGKIGKDKAIETEAEAVLVRSQSSVEIKLDAKRVASFVIKAYADTLKDALEEAVGAYSELRKGLGVDGVQG